MKIQLSDHFTYKRLLRFVFPTILMVIFTSVYGIVDGFFVSNMVGKTEFASLNIVWPFVMILGSIGFMFGAGGSAIISKTFGEGDSKRANRYFSLIIYTAIIAGCILGAAGFIWIRPVSYLLGADESMIEHCVVYGRILMIGMPAFMLQFMFQTFFITAQKPRLGLFVTVAAGVTNMILDYVFIAKLGMGLPGAAIATIIGEAIGGFFPLIYFFARNSSILRLGKTRFEGRVLAKTCTNGVSELLTEVSASIISIIFNKELMKLVGEDGVAAYGVLMYIQFVFAAIFIGFTVGSAPLVSYHYGAENHKELNNLYRKSLIIMGISGILITAVCFVTARPVAGIFVGYDEKLMDMTIQAIRLFSFAFFLGGFNMLGSAFFTALNNGIVSGILSFSRTMVFQIAALFLLPLFLDIKGIWLAIPVAEACTLILTIIAFKIMDSEYHYRKPEYKEE